MPRCSRFKTLFCIKILFALINAIVSHEDIFQHMSFAERRSFFGTADGSVPEFELVELKKPPRSKRTVQDPIDITFNAFGDASTASLNVVENNTLIGRSLTGIWFAETAAWAYHNITYFPRPDIFNFVGEFDLLQNVDEGSAVVRFRKDGNEDIMGILKQNYTVKSVPRDFEYLFVNIHRMRAGKKRSTSAKSLQDSSQILVIFKNPDISQELLRTRRRAQDSILPHRQHHRSKRQQFISVPDIVYPKLLVTPDHSLMSRYLWVEDFVKEFIAQANAVDMMFRQLRDPEVRLNIAGIIIPRDAAAVPYIASVYDPDTYQLNSALAIDSAQRHFYDEQRRFPHDEFDVAFIMTTIPMFKIHDNGYVEDGINGMAVFESGCDGGPAIVKYHEGFEGIHLMAHELAHTFGANHDEEGVAVQCPINDGYTLVPSLEDARILEWSSCSKSSLKLFLRSPLAQCTYNPPIELPEYAQEMEGAWLHMEGQCDNMIQDSHGACVDNTTDTCTFGCETGGPCIFNYLPPMEGSFLNDDTLCIGGKWQPV